MGMVIHTLAVETGLAPSVVERIMYTAPARYKNYTIDKRGGGKRPISQPAREVKVIQRALNEILLKSLPVHDASTAYRDGMSIRNNALPHVGIGPILKLDFANFFPSIKLGDWREYCRETRCLEDETDIIATGQLIFQRPKGTNKMELAIGSPCSPFVSNALMFTFDTLITEAVAKDKVIYTRYADDLTFSAPRLGHLRDVEKVVISVLRNLAYPRLTLNKEKTTYVTSKYGRKVTGLTLTNDGAVSIGHERKRELHTAVYRASTGRLDPEELGRLKGMLGFANSVEPQFIEKLRQRFGHEAIAVIQSYPIPKKGKPKVVAVAPSTGF
ncbi:retron St85 family RNA-directed DNA polymerase [Mesorhizobium sp. M1060]|uniref:retron St85 family RNA-directed DNA polymerase n=1 Tax=Mesorhizobium sp. M1060 TaxID=2957052 RepID=UPI003339F363